MRKGRVLFKNRPVGVIEELEEKGYAFSYNEDYTGPPISLTMPLKERRWTHRVLPPFFDGLIPEGWLLTIIEKNWKLDERDRMGLLLAACAETVGAVTVLPYEDAAETPGGREDSSAVPTQERKEISPIIAQTEKAEQIKKESRPWDRCPICMDLLPENSPAAQLYHPRCSMKLFGSNEAPFVPFRLDDLEEMARKSAMRRVTIPGVQKKISVAIAPSRDPGGGKSRLTITDLWGSHILKPESGDYPELPANEHLTLHLARSAGIETEDFSLIPLADDRPAFVARRFDRSEEERFALEDFAQLTRRLTVEKYRGSLEQAARAIRHYSSVPGDDLLRFFEINLFSFLTGNADMHLKNFSLLTSPARSGRELIRLSPAYDLLNTAIVLENDDEETALTLNAKTKRISRKDFLQFAETIGLPDKAAKNSLERILASTEKWERLIRESFLSEDLRLRYFDLARQRTARMKE